MPGVTSTFYSGILGVTVESGHTRGNGRVRASLLDAGDAGEAAGASASGCEDALDARRSAAEPEDPLATSDAGATTDASSSLLDAGDAGEAAGASASCSIHTLAGRQQPQPLPPSAPVVTVRAKRGGRGWCG